MDLCSYLPRGNHTTHINSGLDFLTLTKRRAHFINLICTVKLKFWSWLQFLSLYIILKIIRSVYSSKILYIIPSSFMHHPNSVFLTGPLPTPLWASRTQKHCEKPLTMSHHSCVSWEERSPPLVFAKSFHVCFPSTAPCQPLYCLLVCSNPKVCMLPFLPIVFCPGLSMLFLILEISM